MPRIPYSSQVSALSGRANSPLQRTQADPAAYGAASASAMLSLGGSLQDAGTAVGNFVAREQERQRKEQSATSVAEFDWTAQELELRRNSTSDAVTLQGEVREGYVSAVDAYVSNIEDDRVRTEVRAKLLADLPNVSARAAQYSYATQEENSKRRINDSLAGLQNKVMSDPTSFDRYRAEGDDLIDAAPGTTAALREGMKVSWKYDLARQRFEGMVNNVNTVEDIDVIATELAGGEGIRDWQSELRPSDYENLIDSLGTLRKTFRTANTSNARSALSSLEERLEQNITLVPPAELEEAQRLVKLTGDAGLEYRMARVMDAQTIIKNESRLPPAEMRARINAASGNPGLAYPGLPVEVSNYINEVSDVTGVPASYLGATANKEFGVEFAKAGNRAQKEREKFAPQTAHARVDLRNIRKDIIDATTLAGQAYGAPLLVTEAQPGQSALSEGAINIATPGMSGEDKARVVSALVDAGFTGFAEYDGYIQAGIQHAVPQSFGQRGDMFWGGWTNLSPEVATTLQEKGFVGGADATALQRATIAGVEDGVDYSAPTGITGEDGRPTSSAQGLYQFIDSTWLNVLKKPGFADKVGVDVASMSDEEILALRSNPRIQTFAAAALAGENKRILENTLGREVDDAELYLAHFMGPTAAVSFLTALKNTPDMNAADLLPSAAAANAPVFYEGGKKSQPFTVEQMYGRVAQGFNLAPSRVAFERNEVRKKMLSQAERQLAEHPIQHAMDTGSHVISPLAEGFSKRGSESRAVADYFNIPVREFKPFTVDEEESIKKTISEGTVDDNIALLADIASMGPDMSVAAFNQIEMKDRVFAHAGSLYLNGERAVAGDIIRGRKRLQENPDLAKQVGATDNRDLDATFFGHVGTALSELPPAEAQTISDAARALYVERMATGKGSDSWSPREFRASVDSVLMNALGDVNGRVTLLPQGVTATDMEFALSRLNVEDWTAMSEDGNPPRYADGGLANPEDFGDEAVLRAIGGGQYKVQLADGTYLTTGEITPDGSRVRAFIFVPDMAKIARNTRAPVAINNRVPIRGTEHLIGGGNR